MPHYRLHRDPKSSHQQIAAAVRSLGQSPVLDVGAAQGFLGQLLAGSGLAVDAVEMNPEWAELCRPYYRHVITGRAEDVAIPDERYRVVVCADVLEHTPDPVAILRKLRGLSAPDATFIVSVPNVAHLAVRLMLLAGRFPKMDRGILDRTHLQFLTRDTAEQMLRDAGLTIVGTRATGIPLDEVWRDGQETALFGALQRAQHALIAALPRLFGMQWIFTAKPAV